MAEWNIREANIPLLLWIYGLTLLGGYFNAGAIILHQRPASHHTGNTSALALAIYRGEGALIKEILAVMLAFTLGAVIAGFIFHDRKLRPAKRYGLVLLGMGLVLMAAVLLRENIRFLLFLGAALMGLQNGMFIFYKSVLARTTHITGVLTDFGFALGGLIRGRRAEFGKMLYYGLSVLFFLIGSGLAAVVVNHGEQAFWLCLSGAYIIFAFFYFCLRKTERFVADA